MDYSSTKYYIMFEDDEDDEFSPETEDKELWFTGKFINFGKMEGSYPDMDRKIYAKPYRTKHDALEVMNKVLFRHKCSLVIEKTMVEG